jgi:hypothetical protein
MRWKLSGATVAVLEDSFGGGAKIIERDGHDGRIEKTFENGRDPMDRWHHFTGSRVKTQKHLQLCVDGTTGYT